VDKIVDVLVNWQALLLAFASFALLGVIRAIGTKKDKDGKIIGGFSFNRFFQMFLPAYPYLLTLGGVFIPGLPLPEKMTGTIMVKILFAIWAGWLSGFSYQLVKKVLEKGFGMAFGTDVAPQVTPPPADPPPPSA
jgi:hypothetical protein